MYTASSVASDVVSFRFPKHELDKLRKRGKNPNAFAKEALETAMRRIEMDEALDRIEKSGYTLAMDPVDIIRRERESH